MLEDTHGGSEGGYGGGGGGGGGGGSEGGGSKRGSPRTETEVLKLPQIRKDGQRVGTPPTGGVFLTGVVFDDVSTCSVVVVITVCVFVCSAYSSLSPASYIYLLMCTSWLFLLL